MKNNDKNVCKRAEVTPVARMNEALTEPERVLVLPAGLDLRSAEDQPGAGDVCDDRDVSDPTDDLDGTGSNDRGQTEDEYCIRGSGGDA